MKNKVLILGSSHIDCINLAAESENKQDLKKQYFFKSLMDIKSDSRIIDYVGGDAEKFSLNPILAQFITDNNEFDEVYLSISGSDYLSICLAKTVPYFDFILPQNKDLEIIPEARIIPYSYVKKKLSDDIMHIILGISEIRKICRSPLYYLESPPPIESNEHVIKYAAWAEAIINKFGPTNPTLRYKFWRLHSEIVEDAAKAAGVIFVPLPAEVLSERGYMHENAIREDLLHANTWFGQRILKKIEAIM